MQLTLRTWALLPLAAWMAHAAQDPQSQQAPLPTLRITVTLVQVDAVVTDSGGRHVAGLTRDDFELLQDGEPQKLTYFSYMPGAPAEAASPGAPITAAQVRRTVALVVDDLALSFDNIVRVRTALRSFVEHDMQPGDLVALVRTGGGVAILEQFTTDKRILLEAIDLLKWRFSGRTGMPSIQDAPDPVPHPVASRPQSQPEILDFNSTLTALGALGTIEQVIGGMKPYPGRKSVVFFSDGFRMNSTVSAALDRLTDLSNRSAVSIYTVDPNGLNTKPSNMNVDLPTPAPDPDAPRQILFPGEDAPLGQLGGLNDLATRTGGLYFANRNDIPECVRQAADDQLGYYLLGYSPAEGTFEKTAKRARFHRIVVRVKQRGLKVRWKSGFEGVPDTAAPAPVSTAQTRERQLLETMASPFAATGLTVRLSSLYYEDQQRGAFVYSMLQFDSHGLTFTHEPDGDWHASIDIITLAYRGFKQPMLQRQGVQEIRLKDDMYQRALKEGFQFNLADTVKEPGVFLIRAVVRDRNSQRIGSASQFLQVPDTRKGQFAVSGIVLELTTANLLRLTGAPIHQDSSAEAWTEGGPAVRRFLPGQAIIYGFLVINPKVIGKLPDFTHQARIYRNGQLFYTGPVYPYKAGGMQDPKRYFEGGILQLGPRLTPGEYLLQVVVSDANGKKKPASVSQWIDFEVTNPAPSATAGM